MTDQPTLCKPISHTESVYMSSMELLAFTIFLNRFMRYRTTLFVALSLFFPLHSHHPTLGRFTVLYRSTTILLGTIIE